MQLGLDVGMSEKIKYIYKSNIYCIGHETFGWPALSFAHKIKICWMRGGETRGVITILSVEVSLCNSAIAAR